MEINFIKDSLLLIAAFSGWGLLYYNVYSSRIRINGKILQIVHSIGSLPNSNKQLDNITFFISLTNHGIKPIIIKEVKLKFTYNNKTFLLDEFFMNGDTYEFNNWFTMTRDDVFTKDNPVKPNSTRFGIVMFGVKDIDAYNNRDKKKLSIIITLSDNKKHKIKFDSNSTLVGLSTIRQYFNKNIPDII